MDDRQEARLRYFRMMRAHVITPEEEARIAELQRNVPMDQRHAMSQLQNACWLSSPQEPSESSKRFVAAQQKQSTISVDYPPVIAPLLKLILRQMAYFLFLMLLIAFGWAVFHG